MIGSACRLAPAARAHGLTTALPDTHVPARSLHLAAGTGGQRARGTGGQGDGGQRGTGDRGGQGDRGQRRTGGQGTEEDRGQGPPLTVKGDGTRARTVLPLSRDTAVTRPRARSDGPALRAPPAMATAPVSDPRGSERGNALLGQCIGALRLLVGLRRFGYFSVRVGAPQHSLPRPLPRGMISLKVDGQIVPSGPARHSRLRSMSQKRSIRGHMEPARMEPARTAIRPRWPHCTPTARSNNSSSRPVAAKCAAGPPGWPVISRGPGAGVAARHGGRDEHASRASGGGRGSRSRRIGADLTSSQKSSR